MMHTPLAVLGDILDFIHDPGDSSQSESTQSGHRFTRNGYLLIEDGHVSARGHRAELEHKLPPNTQIVDHGNALIVPGLVDTHVHYPQCEIIASPGAQLLDWLNSYTFPAESHFSDPAHAAHIAHFFLDELLRNGTTTALVFGTVHPQSVDAFFTQAQKRRLRMICGKVLMDRNAPQELLDTPQSGYDESQLLIDRWHNKDRLGYAITPRFAPTSSAEQLALAGRLKFENSDVHVHTHLAENKAECEWVKNLFPQRQNYLDVYDHYALLGRRSVFAHAIHLHDSEWQRLADTGSNLAHCPTSNLFIGSGLFQLQQADRFNVRTALGTDVGGGDSFSLLRTINEAYKVQQLQGHSLPPLRALYLATLGGARALDLDTHIGNFSIGKEADFIVLNESATPLMRLRSSYCTSLDERLFVLMMLGDDRCVSATYILGEAVTGLAE